MKPGFKRAPVIDKCFTVLELLAQSKEPMGINDISGKLEWTAFNIGHTLTDLNILENQRDGKFVSGTCSYALANMARKPSALMQPAHPHLVLAVSKPPSHPDMTSLSNRHWGYWPDAAPSAQLVNPGVNRATEKDFQRG